MTPTNFDAATLLATVPLLEGLDIDAFNALTPQLEFRSYKADEILFNKGDPGGALLIVLEGSVDLFIYNERNEAITLAQVANGGFFGEVSLFDNSGRTTNARALSPVRVMILRRDVITQFFQDNPPAAIHMISVLSQRLRMTTALIAEKPQDAFEMLDKEQSVWEHIADRAAMTMGSWKYLSLVLPFIALWMLLNVTGILGVWDEPPEFFTLVTILTVVSALGTPLILISQRRQNRLDQIQAKINHQTDLKSELAILEVKNKLDWLQEAMLDQTARLDHLERETGLIRRSRVFNQKP